ncbi:tetratricopeptide repeat protein [Azospirillum sp.]|uniref:tetratricopeptide repeat protein n=1 Tax=Azospirillum sp. TaxID=34012 RepID=UPI00263A1D08|nr:tetratricopeptide repeat protein [Azospirillum sp.]
MDTGTRPSGKRGSGAWKVDALAHDVGVSRRTIDNYRNGSTLPPDALPLADAFFGDDPRHAVRRHAFLIAFAKATGTEPPPWAAAITNVPIREPAHFLGRDEALSALRAAFAGKAGRVAITALHGLRGVGKTTLAATYAERHRADHRAIWWIRAGTEAGLRADLVALGVRLAWVAADLAEELALATVMDRLRDEGDGLLLIYDNALDARQLAPHLPRGGAARILVTSNAPNWRGVADPVEIAVWPPEIGADYLTARTGRTAERGAAKALSIVLGGLPLAHEQAAAYCEYLDIPLAEYHRRFADRTVAMLADPDYAPADYHGGRTVAATFTLAIEAAAALHPAAEPLLAHLALLAPEPIPLFLLREGHTQFAAPLDAQLGGDGLDKAMAALRSLALLGRETITDERVPTVTTETIHVHRLIREVAAARLTAEARETTQGELVRVLCTVYPVDVYNDPKTWLRARRLDGLVMALLDAEAGLPKDAELAAGILLNGVASYRQAALGAYEQARSLFTRALAIRETALGPDHPDTATCLSNLAELYRAQGRLGEAAPLYARALAICETALGPDHPDTATCLSNLAELYRAQGRLEAAAPLFTRSLAITEMTGSKLTK